MEPNYIKPDLLNPVIRQRLVKTITTPEKQYWKPVTKFFSNLYENYIIPNIYLVLFIIFIIFVLIYRYKITQDNRKKKSPNNVENVAVPEYLRYSEPELALMLYQQQRENSREPKSVKKKMDSAYPVYPYDGSRGKFKVTSESKSKSKPKT